MNPLEREERLRLVAAVEAQAAALEALREQIAALTVAVEALTAETALGFPDAPPPVVGAAPLAAGGGAVYPGFPTAFRTRSGGGGR